MDVLSITLRRCTERYKTWDSQLITGEPLIKIFLLKKFLAIHMEETELPLGLELRMGDLQAILKYKLPQSTYQKKVYASLEKLLGPDGRQRITGIDPVKQALAQKTDSEELVTPVTARSNSTKIKGKKTNSENSTKKPTKKKKKSF